MNSLLRQKSPHFSQVSIEALRHTAKFDEWNREFEKLKRAIGRGLSPRDIRPLLKAGVANDKLLEWLAHVVYDANQSHLLQLMERRRSLRSLAAQVTSVIEHATRLVNDPLCDGRFWLALESGLS